MHEPATKLAFMLQYIQRPMTPPDIDLRDRGDGPSKKEREAFRRYAEFKAAGGMEQSGPLTRQQRRRLEKPWKKKRCGRQMEED